MGALVAARYELTVCAPIYAYWPMAAGVGLLHLVLCLMHLKVELANGNLYLLYMCAIISVTHS